MRRGMALDDVCIFFILLYELLYLGVPFYDFIWEKYSIKPVYGNTDPNDIVSRAKNVFNYNYNLENTVKFYYYLYRQF